LPSYLLALLRSEERALVKGPLRRPSFAIGFADTETPRSLTPRSFTTRQGDTATFARDYDAPSIQTYLVMLDFFAPIVFHR
jgi:hypothetical protein